jgi:chromosome segregation ATPase
MLPRMWRSRRFMAAVLGLMACMALTVAAKAQDSKGEQSKPSPSTKDAEKQKGDPRLDQQINQARENLEFLEFQLDTKRAQVKLAEARLDVARRWKTRYEKLFTGGHVTEERLLAAGDEVLMLEAHLAAEKAELKEAEMRAKYARRRLDYGEFPLNPVNERFDDIERRLSSLERKLDLIQHSLGHLNREVPPETR